LSGLSYYIYLLSHPLRRPRRSTLFPYTTLFRSSILTQTDFARALQLERNGLRCAKRPRDRELALSRRSVCRVDSGDWGREGGPKRAQSPRRAEVFDQRIRMSLAAATARASVP